MGSCGRGAVDGELLFRSCCWRAAVRELLLRTVGELLLESGCWGAAFWELLLGSCRCGAAVGELLLGSCCWGAVVGAAAVWEPLVVVRGSFIAKNHWY